MPITSLLDGVGGKTSYLNQSTGSRDSISEVFSAIQSISMTLDQDLWKVLKKCEKVLITLKIGLGN